VKKKHVAHRTPTSSWGRRTREAFATGRVPASNALTEAEQEREIQKDLAAEEAIVERAVRMTPREMLEYFAGILQEISTRCVKRG